MRKNCRSLLLASLALTCGLLASCLSSGPEKPLGAMADAMEKNDSAAFLAQMDMPLFAANEARNMTNENEALNMLDSLGQDLGLGGMDQLLGSALNMEDKLRKSLTRGVSTGELMAHCRKAERPDCPWVPESLRNAKVVADEAGGHRARYAARRAGQHRGAGDHPDGRLAGGTRRRPHEHPGPGTGQLAVACRCQKADPCAGR